ncbi:MAG: type II toxin-antitoxin system VapC family toxin [Fimbriimonadales bacterium]|nr:type II toxin-antitoxin system VapC family toxin [Fimbriimonadales bacterium]
MSSLDVHLQGVRELGFDTAPFIYFVEQHPRYVDVVREIIRRIDEGQIRGYTSVVALTEVLTLPIRLRRSDLENEYRNFLLGSRYFRVIPITVDVAETAADLRARYNLRTPDALQLAAAIRRGCDAFLTNDANLQRVSELRVLTLNLLTNNAS